MPERSGRLRRSQGAVCSDPRGSFAALPEGTLGRLRGSRMAFHSGPSRAPQRGALRPSVAAGRGQGALEGIATEVGDEQRLGRRTDGSLDRGKLGERGRRR